MGITEEVVGIIPTFIAIKAVDEAIKVTKKSSKRR